MSETLLDLSGIRTGYGRIEALHGLDVTIAKGETVALVGANGAGKSTLLKVISGLQPLTGGTVTFCLLYTSPSPRDKRQSRMPSSA